MPRDDGPRAGGPGHAPMARLVPGGRDPVTAVSVADVVAWLERLFVAAEGASLRDEDRRKAVQVSAVLEEVARAMRRVARRERLVLVDAAAGKSYVGLLAARLLLEPSGRDAAVVTLEERPDRVAASRAAVARLGTRIPIDCRVARVDDLAAWPETPAIVVALHACGAAADAIIDAATARLARHLLLAPCCTSGAVAGMSEACAAAERLGIPRQAPVRRRFLQALVDAARTRRLEAAGYEVEVVEFVGATVTPHNLLWRCRRGRRPAPRGLAPRRPDVGIDPWAP